MRFVKEVEWIVNILNSPFVIGLNSKFGSVVEFERIIGASENNKDFRKWFHDCIKKDIFQIESNNGFKKYKAIPSRLIDLMKENPIGELAYKFSVKHFAGDYIFR